MAVTITDTRVVVNEGDTTAGWTSNEGLTVFTADPSPVESTGSLGAAVSIETSYVVATLTAANLTNTLCYVWVLANGTMDTLTNGGIGLVLGDGTDRIGFHTAGSDVAAFRHSEGPVGWQCLVIDTSNLPANTTAINGSLANLTITAITEIGAQYKTLSKALGGAANCFTDIVFYGNGGLIITGGGVGTEGKFTEIAVRDRSGADHPGQNVASATGGAYGIIRELGANLKGLQGPLTFGDASGTASVNFADTNQTIVFEERGLAADKYSITVTGNSTGSTSFILGTRVAEGLGNNGCSISATTGAAFTASSANIDTLGLYGTVLRGFTQGVTFTTDATAGPNHEIFQCEFSGCGLITIGTTEFKNNSITNSPAASAALISSTTNVSDLTFASSGTGHAILINTPGTYDFTNFTYEGYATVDGTTGNEVLYNNSGGAVTINVSGGDVPTVRNGAGASTTVNATVSITVTGLKDNTEVRVYTSEDNTPPYATPVELAGVENATDGTTDNRSFTFSATPSSTLYIRIFNTQWIADDITYLVPGTNAQIPVSQRRDRVYSNP